MAVELRLGVRFKLREMEHGRRLGLVPSFVVCDIPIHEQPIRHVIVDSDLRYDR